MSLFESHLKKILQDSEIYNSNKYFNRDQMGWFDFDHVLIELSMMKNDSINASMKYYMIWASVGQIISFKKQKRWKNVSELQKWFDTKLKYLLKLDSKFGGKNKSLTNTLDNKSQEQLLRYCIQDMNDISIYSDGLIYFLVNRLSFVIFNDLFCANVENQVFGDKSIQFKNLFQLFWDFSVYNVLKPIHGGKIWESRYISLYFKLKDACFNNVLLQQLQFRESGTLLFGAAEREMVHYCQVLLSEGHFDCLAPNSKRFNQTPLDRAKSKQNATIIANMQRYIHKKHNNSNNNQINEKTSKTSGDTVTTGNPTVSVDEKKDGNMSNNDIKITRVADTANNANSSEIEAQYLTFMNEQHFSKFFLLSMGFESINKDEKNIIGLKHKNRLASRSICDEDCLYIDFNKLKGVINYNNNIGVKEKQMIMDNLTLNMISLIDKKCAISDGILILCFEYCAMKAKYYYSYSLLDKFTSVLENMVQTCLDDKYQSNETKLFDYHYFKHFFLKSNIWLCKMPPRMTFDDKVQLSPQWKKDVIVSYLSPKSNLTLQQLQKQQSPWANSNAAPLPGAQGVPPPPSLIGNIAAVPSIPAIPAIPAIPGLPSLPGMSGVKENNCKSKTDEKESFDSVAFGKQSLYFVIARKMVDVALIEQQKFIWKHVQRAKIENEKSWNNILHFGKNIVLVKNDDDLTNGSSGDLR